MGVEEVLVGDRMVDSPASLVTTEYGWRANMQRIMKAQVLRDSQMSSFMVGKKKMEVNPDHQIMIELLKKFKRNRKSFLLLMLSWMTPWKKSTKVLVFLPPAPIPEQTRKRTNPAEAEARKNTIFYYRTTHSGRGGWGKASHTNRVFGRRLLF